LKPDAKLNNANSQTQNVMKQLRTENRRLHTQIVKLQVRRISDKNRIAALEKQLKEKIEEKFHTGISRADAKDILLQAARKGPDDLRGPWARDSEQRAGEATSDSAPSAEPEPSQS